LQPLKYGLYTVDFTREPIIETVITPKDGCTLVVRSSTNSRQEEYFVDAVEVVSFGKASFFRSRERPKSFIVPVSDYEILEVRETRLVLKNVAFDRSIKIAGGREASPRGSRESSDRTASSAPEIVEEKIPAAVVTVAATAEKGENRLEKRRERRRNYKRKRDELTPCDDTSTEETADTIETAEGQQKGDLYTEKPEGNIPGGVTSVISSLLPPPPNLISETIARYRDNALFKGAFFTKDEEQRSTPSSEGMERAEGEEGREAEEIKEDSHPLVMEEDDSVQLPTISLDQPRYGAFEISEEEAETVYRERQSRRPSLSTTPEPSEAVEPAETVEPSASGAPSEEAAADNDGHESAKIDETDQLELPTSSESENEGNMTQ
jgi:hypothetical protein